MPDSNEIFKSNMNALRRRHAGAAAALDAWLVSPKRGAFELVEGRRGFPTLSFGDAAGARKFVHSIFDPVREAERLAAKLVAERRDAYVFFGMGLGYSVSGLLPVLPVDTCVAVFEPSLEAFALAMSAVPLQDVLLHPRVFVAAGPSPEDSRIELLNFLSDFQPKDFGLEAEAHTELFEDFNRRAAAVIEGCLGICRNLGHTREKIHRMCQLNSARNLKYMMRHSGLDAMRGIFAGVPAVIAGPGAGVIKVLDGLRHLSGSCIVFALNEAGRFLAERGLPAHFVAAMDPQEVMLTKIGPDVPKESRWLFADCAYAGLVEAYHENAFIVPSVGGVTPALRAAGLTGAYVSTGPTVATLALTLAEFFGCSPIAFCGLDFRLYHGKRYPWSDFAERRAEIIMGESIWGCGIETTPELNTYCEQFGSQAELLGAPIVDIREGGLKTSGAEIMSWKSFLARTPSGNAVDAVRRFDAARRERAPAVSAARKKFYQSIGERHSSVRDRAMELLEGFKRLRETGGPASADEAIALTLAVEELAVEPVWMLLRGRFRPVTVSCSDMRAADNLPRAVGFMEDYLEKTVELFNATEKTFLK